jgi:hypothetical protein
MAEGASQPPSRRERRATKRDEAKRKEPTLSELSRTLPGTADLTAAKDEYFKTDNDKVAILLHASVLDANLGVCIALHIADANPLISYDEVQKIIHGEHAALGTFSSKIHLAYLVGIVDAAARNDLDCIRRIRNAFAHSALPLTFQTKQVVDECKKLQLKRSDFTISTNRDMVFSSYLCILNQYGVYIKSKTRPLALLRKYGPRRQILTQILDQIRTALGLPPESSQA